MKIGSKGHYGLLAFAELAANYRYADPCKSERSLGTKIFHLSTSVRLWWC